MNRSLPRIPIRRRSAAWLPALLLLWVAGCGAGPRTDYAAANLSQVSGTVKLDGQPLEGATVRFYAEDGLTFSFGRTDSGGRYTLRFDSEATGIQQGIKTIRITTASGGDDEGDAGDGAEGNAAGRRSAERVPARYNAQSELQRTVDLPSHTFDFDLTTAD